MSQPAKKDEAEFKKLLNDDWEDRAREERRSDKDNRNAQDQRYFKAGGKERRQTSERRRIEERRDGWMRVGRWRSISVFDD